MAAHRSILFCAKPNRPDVERFMNWNRVENRDRKKNIRCIVSLRISSIFFIVSAVIPNLEGVSRDLEQRNVIIPRYFWMWVRLAVDGKKKKRYKDLTTNDDKFMRISPLPLSLSSSTDENEGRGSAWRNLCTPICTYTYTRVYEIIVQQRFRPLVTVVPSFLMHNYFLHPSGENGLDENFEIIREIEHPAPFRCTFSSLSITHSWFRTWDADGRHILETRVREWNVATVVGCKKRRRRRRRKLFFLLAEEKFDSIARSFFSFSPNEIIIRTVEIILITIIFLQLENY